MEDTLQTPLAEMVSDITLNEASLIERWLSLNIQPKPKWLPQFVWNKVLKRVLILHDRR